jgi:hypothetical protein
MTSDPDDDLESMSHADLLLAARAMRHAIRAHRDTTEHDLCWHHPDLWALLPDPPQVKPIVPERPQFMRGCVRYRQSPDQQLGGALRTSREFDETPGSLAMDQEATIKLSVAEALILSHCLDRLNSEERLSPLVDSVEQWALWALDNVLEAWNPVILSDDYEIHLQEAKSSITRGTGE